MGNLPESISIRRFEMGDRGMVNEFFDQMVGESKAFFNRSDGNRRNAMRFFDGEAPNTDYFLAESGGVMAGYVFLWDMDKGVAWLGIAVREGFKGKGLGKLLMGHAADHARVDGKGGILLTTHTANLRGQVLYEGSGYERLGMHTSGELLYLLRF